MGKTHKIRIIVPANTNAFNTRILHAVEPVIPPDFEIDITNITQGKDCIQNRYNRTQNALPLVELARKTEEEGYEGIFVSDFDYCGVEPAREVVDIPVIGAFRASAFTAQMLAERFSIITILDSTVAMQHEHIKTFGLEQNFASIRSINCPVKQLENTELVKELVFTECVRAIETDQAQAFILGCTGFVGISETVSTLLSEKYGGFIPVVDPNKSAICYLILLIRNRLTQSRICYTKAACNI